VKREKNKKTGEDVVRAEKKVAESMSLPTIRATTHQGEVMKPSLLLNLSYPAPVMIPSPVVGVEREKNKKTR
jgi:hypothetical protein